MPPDPRGHDPKVAGLHVGIGATHRRCAEWIRPLCFAHDGVAQLGVIDGYECGIYERICGWLDALGVQHETSPDVLHCTMYHEGSCVREIRCTFPVA